MDEHQVLKVNESAIFGDFKDGWLIIP